MVQASLGPQEDTSKVLMMSALDEIHRMEERESDPRQRRRVEGMCVGLRNIGNTCYVNSLVQTYFLLPPLRTAILNANARAAALPAPPAPEYNMDLELKQALALSMEMEGQTMEGQAEEPVGGGAGEAQALTSTQEVPVPDPTEAAGDAAAEPTDDARKKDAMHCLWQLQRVFALLCHSHRR